MTQLPPMPGPSRRRSRADVPDQIEGARQAWLAVCVLQVVYAAVVAAGIWSEPGELLAQMSAGAVAGDVNDLPPEQRTWAVRMAAVMMFVFMAALAGLFAWLTRRMRDGSAGARLVLVAGSVYLAVGAAFTVFGQPSAPVPEAAAPLLHFGAGAASILSGVAGVAGVVLASGARAREWFAGPRDDGDRPGGGPDPKGGPR
ncbi:hypothetical protein [Corynebacterium sp. 335C]